MRKSIRPPFVSSVVETQNRAANDRFSTSLETNGEGVRNG
jgi:hypothetical protein